MVHVAVIGTGGWGKNHVRVLSELGALAALCDIDAERAKTYGEKYHVKWYTDAEEMLRKEELDAATVCTPTFTHLEVATKTIDAGLHTLVEKPLTYASSDGQRLVEAAAAKKVILTVGYIERYNPAVTELKKTLELGKLGEPLLLEFHRENKWGGTVRDVGVITDTSVHDIDTARWIFGGEPKVVFARTGSVLSKHEDFAAIILGFDGQRTAFITSNWVTPKRVRQLVTVCTDGIITLDFVTQEIRIDDSGGTTVPRRQWQEPLMLELEGFLECIEKKKPPLVTGKDAVSTTKIAEAALISSQTGAPIYLQL